MSVDKIDNKMHRKIADSFAPIAISGSSSNVTKIDGGNSQQNLVTF